MVINPFPSDSQLVALMPWLESGDRISRPEFERRYQAMPQLKKAELIEGVVYVSSPVRSSSHARPHAAIMGWLFHYWVATPGVVVNDNPTIRLDADNEPQPDACLRIETGGQSSLSADDYIEGAPELVVEVAASSVANDVHDKKHVYRRNGVQEYLVWCVLDQTIDWFGLQQEIYVPLQPDGAGVIHSQVFPGLRLDVASLLAGNLSQVIIVLQQGLNTPEHDQFVHQLQQV
ncbi:Uma2 family endonuclease [Synechococcales cyanobacterium C]|uniref:Uma2 family endonuclease n=2 Tax=Petrachloros TaxID=2918834 RepID=A0A8K1ZZC3_9CYAN|nr:Uma2 family endonuclease [Petrachloros mirabilis]NCJ06868.1 Uma2 family endonuclease [Petrachloros mirabilis ULC683]